MQQRQKSFTSKMIRMPTHYRSVSQLVPLWILCFTIISGIGWVSETGHSYLLFAFFFIYTTIVISILLQVHGIANYGNLFLWALIVRLVLVLAIEALPPEATPGALKSFLRVIWKDEGYYLGTARWLGQSFESFARMNVSNPYERVAGFYGLWILLFGDATVWGRLVNVFLGATTVVILYDALVRVVRKKTKHLLFWFLVLSPVLLHFSIVYMKEPLLIFSISLIVNAIVKLYDRNSLFLQLFKLGLGAGIGIWTRNTSLIPLLLPLGLTLVYSTKIKNSSRFLFVPISVLFFVTVGLIAAQPAVVAEKVSGFVNLQGVDTFLYSQNPLNRTISFPFYDFISGLPQLLRSIGLTFLTMLSPTITSVWHMFPILGHPNWYVFAVSSHAISWWVCLPLIGYTIYRTFQERDVWWLGWSGCLLLWVVICANAQQGADFDAFRYRDSLVPVITLLAAKGLDRTLYPVDKSRERIWKYVLRVYIVFVVFIILATGIGLIGM